MPASSAWTLSVPFGIIGSLFVGFLDMPQGLIAVMAIFVTIAMQKVEREEGRGRLAYLWDFLKAFLILGTCALIAYLARIYALGGSIVTHGP